MRRVLIIRTFDPLFLLQSKLGYTALLLLVLDARVMFATMLLLLACRHRRGDTLFLLVASGVRMLFFLIYV